ncbi:MAG: transposase, partial [Acidobacteriota bacterium]
EDYAGYLDLLAQWCGREGVEVWVYCLMPNHVHLMVVPHTPEGLARAIGETHRRYTRLINLREEWRGYLWQGRFASFPMERAHALACARYIEWNPVRARLVKRPEEWRWSSARAHLAGATGPLIRSSRPLRNAGEWASLLKGGLGEAEAEAEVIRRRERTGRPLGSEGFLQRLETRLGRALKPRKPGRKKREE